jgi:hypothetical protein
MAYIDGMGMAGNDSSEFERFLLPEKELSLKVVFDNFRNYAIIGGLTAMAHWFQSGKASAPPIIFNGPPRGGWEANAWICLAVAAVLFILNVWQSYHIAARLLGFDRKGSGAGREALNALPWYVQLLFIAIASCLSAVVIGVAFLLFNLAIYIVWFSVAGGLR